MKTTLVLDDRLLERVRLLAAKERRNMSEIVEAALRTFFDASAPAAKKKTQLPTFSSGGFVVDPSDRDAMRRALGGRW